ncbi:MAG: Dephospho-CoA kinase, partial [Planctomycetota bacterium]
ASGKSEVTRMLESRGAHVIRADKIGHQVLEDPAVGRLVIRQFGQSIVASDGHTIDRRQLGQKVFGDSPQAIARRRILESITHPPIRKRIRTELEHAVQESGSRWIVLDIPLLHESRWDRACDVVWFVDAPEEIRIQRALARGWTLEHFRAREASQWSIGSKKAHSTWVLRNDGSLEELELEVQRALGNADCSELR